SDSATEGWSEAVHKRPLLNPDEIGRMLARIDDRQRPGYPGLVLALIPGEHPLLARRVNYYQSRSFLGFFDPHPDHPPPLTLAEIEALPPPARVRRKRQSESSAARRFLFGMFLFGVLPVSVLVVLLIYGALMTPH